MSASSRPRKRYKSVTAVACLVCRQKHEKCDGGHPCGLCARLGKDCVYIQPKKRGPRKGFRKKLDERLNDLETALRQQTETTERFKQQVRELQTSQAKSLTTTPRSGLTGVVATNNLTSQMLASTSINLSFYTQIFHKFHSPFTQLIKNNIGDYTQFLSQKPWDYLRKLPALDLLKLYSICTWSAMHNGQFEHGKRFAVIAQSLSKGLYDQPQVNTAACFMLLSAYYAVAAEIRISHFYASTTVNHLEHVMAYNNGENDGVKAFLMIAKLHKIQFGSISSQLVSMQVIIEELLGCYYTLSKECKMTLAEILIERVVVQCEMTMQNKLPMSEDKKSECVLHLSKASEIISESKKEAYADLFDLHDSAETLYFLVTEQLEAARNGADKILTTMQVTKKYMHDISKVLQLRNCCFVYMAVGDQEKEVTCMNMMVEMGKRWPILKAVSGTMKKLRKENTTENYMDTLTQLFFSPSGLSGLDKFVAAYRDDQAKLSGKKRKLEDTATRGSLSTSADARDVLPLCQIDTSGSLSGSSDYYDITSGDSGVATDWNINLTQPQMLPPGSVGSAFVDQIFMPTPSTPSNNDLDIMGNPEFWVDIPPNGPVWSP